MKQCSKCKEVKPLSEFRKRKEAKDGLRDQCRVCQRAVEAIRFKAKEEEYTAYRKAYYLANREAINAKNAAYYRQNKDAAVERVKVWKKANPDRIKPGSDRRNARPRIKALKRLSCGLTRSRSNWFQWSEEVPIAEVAAFWGLECWPHEPTIEAVAKIVETMKPGDHLDHILSIAQGGNPVDPANLQVISKADHAAKTALERSGLRGYPYGYEGVPL